MRKILAMLLVLVMVLGLFAACGNTAPAATEAPETQPVETEAAVQGDIVILYTNDVHTYIDGPLSYDVIAAVKEELLKQYAYVLLVDAGDHAQGTAFGSMDKGETIIKLMNAAGYDAATLGNHEFDYGMDGAMNLVEWAEYPYLSCNFYHEEAGVKGECVLNPYELFPFGGETIAIVGVTTPETFTKSTPAYFQDEMGNYIYGISGGEDGAALCADLQAAIDDAKEAGATKVIALGHLGDDPASQPWTSKETIANVTGLTAFIDGHSHSTVEMETVADKDGNAVALTQTGEYFDRIGMMVIDGETGAITTDFIEYAEILETVTGEDGKAVLDEDGNEVTEVVGYEFVSDLYQGASWCSDEEVATIKNAWIEEIDTQLGTVIGTSNVALGNYADGSRLVRSQETNTGDFCADALYFLFDDMGLDVDVAIMNGGGVRNKTDITGEFSYKTAKEIHTFGNVACLQTITGQQLLDALEWGARCAGTEEECGGFLQVSGITYKINTSWESSVQMDDKGVWTGAPTGGYRVQDVMVYNKETQAYEPLDLEATYNLAGYNYTLRDLGDGFNMFSGAVNVLDYVMEDYMVLANYIQAFEDGVVDAGNSPLLESYPNMLVDYSTVYGSGRIACVEYDDVLLTMNAEEQYEMNIFLSNFSEQGFPYKRAYKFETETADAVELAKFGWWHTRLNDWESLENVDHGDDSYQGVDIEIINAITQRFFGRPVDIVDIPTEQVDENDFIAVDGKVCYPKALGDPHTNMSVVEKMYGFGDGTIQVFFDIYHVSVSSGYTDGYAITDNSVYYFTQSEAEANQYFEYNGSGVAVVRPYTTESGEETYQLVSYEVVVK